MMNDYSLYESNLLRNVLVGAITGDGIFSTFVNPVWEDDFDSSLLDIAFISMYGDKLISPFMYNFVDDDGECTGNDLQLLANVIYNIKANSWEHLYNAAKAEYNPIENTDATETVTETRSGSGTDGNTRTLNTTNTTSNTVNVDVSGSVSGSNSQTTTGSGSKSDNVFAFDSSNAVPKATSSDSESNTTSGTNSSTTESESESTSSGSNRDTGTITDSGSNSHTETLTRNYRKHGNIGVMTMNQLLAGDVEFWQWNFIQNVFADIVDMITLRVY